ncbi:hypothetical protein [Gimibacter soli]|uniref:Uncharacterized protein n=1 Tax=Gimibacter soli TaxID=3024400 RepID=A0AAE9XN44_9PROT|nr:hypothetical protein [Gimibacter soli]WCL53092.1 hypothetical protein PH603_11130 [Gimibacter soli]
MKDEGTMYYSPIDIEGIRRIAQLELSRRQFGSREEAMTYLHGHLGAYDLEGEAIADGLDAHFAAPASTR